MKADGLLISAEELSWRNPISVSPSRIDECIGDYAQFEFYIDRIPIRW